MVARVSEQHEKDRVAHDKRDSWERRGQRAVSLAKVVEFCKGQVEGIFRVTMADGGRWMEKGEGLTCRSRGGGRYE